jgi:hypothetical protein
MNRTGRDERRPQPEGEHRHFTLTANPSPGWQVTITSTGKKAADLAVLDGLPVPPV